MMVSKQTESQMSDVPVLEDLLVQGNTSTSWCTSEIVSSAQKDGEEKG